VLNNEYCISLFLCALVSLVEPCSQPMGVTLVNTIYTNKPSDCMDLVELAHQVQRVCCNKIIHNVVISAQFLYILHIFYTVIVVRKSILCVNRLNVSVWICDFL